MRAIVAQPRSALGRGRLGGRRRRAGARRGDVCRRLLLVHGAAVRQAATASSRPRPGYTGGHTKNPTYEQVSAGRHRPRRGGRDRLRPREGHATRSSSTCSGATSTRSTPNAPVLRRRQPVPLRHLRPRRDPAAPGRSIQAGRRGAPGQAGRHRDRLGRHVLARGGLPPGLLQEEPDPLQVLPRRLRPRPATGGDLGAGRERPHRAR